MEKTSLLINEKGSVVVLAIVMLALLTILGMAVTRTSSIEVQIAANDQQAVDCLYKAESADHLAIELINTWMTNTFLTQSTTASAVSPDLDNDGSDDVNTDLDGDGTSGDFRVEIRCIEGSGGVNITGFSTAANDLPTMQHISVPPVGSGTSLGGYIIRRYGITGTASNGCSVVQVGAYKIFNNFVP